MIARTPRRPAGRPARRGVTLLEMLVDVGAARPDHDHPGRRSSARHRRPPSPADLRRARPGYPPDRHDLPPDLAGMTANGMTPSAAGNPAQDRGYFTYGENALADLQGEDTDDYLAFTAEAPAGRPFTGYMTVPAPSTGRHDGRPRRFNRVPISSDFAEVVYFLRNGNLYRRVLLILPTKQELGIGASARHQRLGSVRRTAGHHRPRPVHRQPGCSAPQRQLGAGQRPLRGRARPARHRRPAPLVRPAAQHARRPDQPREPGVQPAVHQRLRRTTTAAAPITSPRRHPRRPNRAPRLLPTSTRPLYPAGSPAASTSARRRPGPARPEQPPASPSRSSIPNPYSGADLTDGRSTR